MSIETAIDPRKLTRIWTDLDLDQEGRVFGHLRLNISTHARGASWIPIPIASFKNGDGPRVLLLGGVHGDEYEGQVMAMNLMRTLEVENVRGQIIIMPAANAPAAFAGRRTSPLDEGNLNRAYPGDPNGTPTQEIAYYIDSVLLPQADYLLDFHSGGISNYVLPSAHVYHSNDPQTLARLVEMLEVFGMPNSVILKGLIDHDKKAIGACERRGVLRFASELGGAGGITVDSLRRAEKGLARLLHHIGSLRQPITDEPAPPIRLLRRLPNRDYAYAMASGLFEPRVVIGQAVSAGEVGGMIHFPREPWREPLPVAFANDGIVYAIRAHATTEIGDALFVLAVPWAA